MKLYGSIYPPIKRDINIIHLVLCDETHGRHYSKGRSPGMTTICSNDVTDLSIATERYHTGYSCFSCHSAAEADTARSWFLHGTTYGRCASTGQGRG